MADPEFIRVPMKHIPPDVKNKHNVYNLVTNGWVYIKIQKVMPGLKQAATLACQHLKKHLDPYCCILVKGKIATWQHYKRPTNYVFV